MQIAGRAKAKINLPVATEADGADGRSSIENAALVLSGSLLVALACMYAHAPPYPSFPSRPGPILTNEQKRDEFLPLPAPTATCVEKVLHAHSVETASKSSN